MAIYDRVTQGYLTEEQIASIIMSVEEEMASVRRMLEFTSTQVELGITGAESRHRENFTKFKNLAALRTYYIQIGGKA